MKFEFHQDPSHGWVKIKTSLIKELGIEKEISKYSYIKGNHVYLEEDSDLTAFLIAMKKEEKDVNFKVIHTDNPSKIRSYRSYPTNTETILFSED